MVVMPQEAACTSSLVCQALADWVTRDNIYIYILKHKVHNIHSEEIKEAAKLTGVGLKA